MKAFIKAFLFLSAFFSNTLVSAQEIALKERGSVDVYYTYGDVTALRFSNIPKEKEFKMNFGDPNLIQYGLPDKNALANVSGMAIRFRAWTVLGELVTHPTVVWAINKQFLKGEKHLVQYAKISKYPDLAKRYYNIKPYYMRAIVGMGLNPKNIYDGGAYAWFKIADNDVLFNNSAAHPATFPTAPLNTGEGMIISTDDQRKTFVANFSSFIAINNQKEVAKRLMEATTVADFAWIKLSEGNARKNGTANNQNIYLELKWPLKAIDEIQELYEKYEKGEASPLEKLNEQLAKENHKSYSGNEDWAKPFVNEIKEVEIFKNGSFLGLKSGNRIIATFSTNEYKDIILLKNTPYYVVDAASYMHAREKDGTVLIDKRGVLKSVDNRNKFANVYPESRTSDYIVVEFYEGVVYRKTIKYPVLYGNEFVDKPIGSFRTLEEAKNKLDYFPVYKGRDTRPLAYHIVKLKCVVVDKNLNYKSTHYRYVNSSDN